MSRVQTTCVIGIAVAILLSARGPAVGFNPQPEPPADQWGVQGFIDMTALTATPTNGIMPFGLDPGIIGDGQVDFRAGIRASFTAPDNDGDLKPDDGTFMATTQFFDLTIGDTQWSHTMLVPEFKFQLKSGLVTGLSGIYTDTLIAHPDLEFMFPASPGQWIATDERFGDNRGTISGSYTLRDAEVPEPASLAVFGGMSMLLIGLGLYRRRYCS